MLHFKLHLNFRLFWFFHANLRRNASRKQRITHILLNRNYRSNGAAEHTIESRLSCFLHSLELVIHWSFWDFTSFIPFARLSRLSPTPSAIRLKHSYSTCRCYMEILFLFLLFLFSCHYRLERFLHTFTNIHTHTYAYSVFVFYSCPSFRGGFTSSASWLA